MFRTLITSLKVGDMAATNTNWVYDKNVVTDRDLKTLEKAKQMEKEKLANGYRYVKIDNRTKALVQCDKDGNPTKEGEESIKAIKASL